MPVKEFDEIILTTEAIRDYQVCELYYDYRYLQYEPVPISGREILAQRFENTLKKVASFFFYKKQGHIVPSYNALLNRWEKLWFPKDTDAFDLTYERHETAHGNLASYSNVATAALLQFHEDFAEDDSEPILIDENYLVPLARNVRLKGRFDLVLRKNGRYKIVKWSGRQRRPAISSFGLDFASLRLAFEHRNESNRSASFALYDLASTKPGFVPVYPTEDDAKAMIFWANQICSSESFVPRRGFTVYCKGCPYDEPCSKFVFPITKGKS